MSENISVHEITSNDLKWIVENSNMPADFKKAAEQEYDRRASLRYDSRVCMEATLNDVCKCKSQV